MKKFNLYATVTISIYTTVEAETLEEAIAESESRDIEYAHNWNTEQQQTYAWVAEEFDGSPDKIQEA